MKNIVLDTNILYQEGLSSGRMKILAKLVTSELITIYVPDIVKREFITKRISEITDEIKKIQGSFKTLLRKIDGEGEFKDRTNTLDSGINDLMQNVQENVEKEFADWMESLNATILSFEPEQIENVLNDYFIGCGAFKSQKNREDFPDSMIHHSICQLVDKIGETYVILADGAFKRGIKAKENVITLNSLNDLLKLDDINDFLTNEQLNDYFVSASFSESLLAYFQDEEDQIEEIYISDSIENLALIGIRQYGAELNFPSLDEMSSIVISDFYAISETEFTADISFKTISTLHYVSYYGDYLQIKDDPSRDVDMDSMSGDGMCDLHEAFSVQYIGKINLLFKDAQTVETIRPIMENLPVDSDSVVINLDIESANLLDFIA